MIRLKLAKKGTEILQLNNNKVQFSSMTRIMKMLHGKIIFNYVMTLRIRGGEIQFIAFQVHCRSCVPDCLAKNLHHTGIHDSPFCTSCNENFEMDKDHLLYWSLFNEKDLDIGKLER